MSNTLRNLESQKQERARNTRQHLANAALLLSYVRGASGWYAICKNRAREADYAVLLAEPEQAADHLVKALYRTGGAGEEEYLPELDAIADAAASVPGERPSIVTLAAEEVGAAENALRAALLDADRIANDMGESFSPEAWIDVLLAEHDMHPDVSAAEIINAQSPQK